MTAGADEAFEPARVVSHLEELLAASVPPAGPTIEDGDPDTGEWTRTRGEGFVIVPLWESGPHTGEYGPEWTVRRSRRSAN